MVVTLGVGTDEGGESSRTLFDPSTRPRLHGIFGSTKRKTMLDWRDHIASDPKVMLGKPCFKGTRIPVDLILEKMAYGEVEAEILEGYPRLTNESIRAALLYAVDSVRNDITYAD